MQAKTYQVVIVGYGGMGSQHAKMLKDVKRMNVYGTYDIREERQQAARNNGYHTYETLDEVLTDSQVDIILIATPNDIHKEIAVKAMEAGKHVICEKPVTMNSEEFQVILDTAEKENKVFAVHQNRRWDEDFLVIKELYDNKELGEVFNIEQRIHGSRGIPGDWRHEKQFGGGMMLDWGVHIIDRITILIPEKITDIYCKMSYVLGNEVDDGFKLLITFESGKTAVFEVGTCHYISLPIWYMTGTEGSVTIEDWDMNGKIAKLMSHQDKDATPIEAGAGLTKTMAPRGENTVNEYPIPRIKSDVREFYYNFVDVIEGNGELVVKNHEVMRVMKIMEAAFKSSERNEVVKFE